MSRSSSPCSTFLELVSLRLFRVERNCEGNARKANGSLGSAFLPTQFAGTTDGEPEQKRPPDSVWLWGCQGYASSFVYVSAVKVSMT